MNRPIKMTVETIDQEFQMSADVAVTVMTVNKPYQEYEGSYAVTPTRETQRLSTKGLFMKGNVIVNPIPPEYGLITWDGSTLTVS